MNAFYLKKISSIYYFLPHNQINNWILTKHFFGQFLSSKDLINAVFSFHHIFFCSFLLLQILECLLHELIQIEIDMKRFDLVLAFQFQSIGLLCVYDLLTSMLKQFDWPQLFIFSVENEISCVLRKTMKIKSWQKNNFFA